MLAVLRARDKEAAVGHDVADGLDAAPLAPVLGEHAPGPAVPPLPNGDVPALPPPPPHAAMKTAKATVLEIFSNLSMRGSLAFM
jgi:hypothetical protein